jgi:hypothetical protein
VRYFANPSTPRVREAMSAGLLDCIDTPLQGNAHVPPDARWCADNGCYGKGYPGDAPWWEWLERHPGRDLCAFAVAPDVVADAAATLARSAPWLPQIRGLGIPAAYVAQDGLEDAPPPWDEFDVLFIGGLDDFKLGPIARAAAIEAKRRGKSVHMGRVNSEKRIRYAAAIGCDSADGTHITYGPDVNLPDVLAWVRGINTQPPLEGITA